MIQEDYVSFEVAKLLKEKGFDVWGDGSIGTATKIWKEYGPSNGKLYDCSTGSPSRKAFPAPTLQMAMKWLREKHDLHIEITSIKPYGSDGNGHDISLDGVEYHSNIVQNNKWIDTIKKFKSYSIACYHSYEEACEAAIKYCLKNLI